MSPGDIDTILRTLERQNEVMTNQGNDLSEIKAQVKLTNGRVTKLEAEALVSDALKKQAKELSDLHGIVQVNRRTFMLMSLAIGATILGAVLSGHLF